MKRAVSPPKPRSVHEDLRHCSVDIEEWAGPVNPGTCSVFVFSCNTADPQKYSKECKYSTRKGIIVFLWVCLSSKIHMVGHLKQVSQSGHFFIKLFLRMTVQLITPLSVFRSMKKNSQKYASSCFVYVVCLLS